MLHHVTVEILALAQAGRDVNAVYTERAVRMEDWKRTANVMIKHTDGAIELQLPTSESLELILKAMPQSLAEEIMKAAENAEMAQTEDGTEEVLSEVSAQQNVDPKSIDAEEKATMRAIKQAIYQTRNNIPRSISYLCWIGLSFRPIPFAIYLPVFLSVLPWGESRFPLVLFRALEVWSWEVWLAHSELGSMTAADQPSGLDRRPPHWPDRKQGGGKPEAT